MRVLQLGLRVTNLERSLTFYTAVGYAKIGGVPETEFGSLTMLQLPDDPFASLELVHDPARPVEGIGAVNHLVVHVDDLSATIADLAIRGVMAEPPTKLGRGCGRHGSPIPTATGSSSCSGHPIIRPV